MQWIVSTAMGQNGEKMVILQLLTPQGSSVFFLPPDAAEAMGSQLHTEGQQAATGLFVPQIVPPTDLRGDGPPKS